jgi:hypothetical protein
MGATQSSPTFRRTGPNPEATLGRHPQLQPPLRDLGVDRIITGKLQLARRKARGNHNFANSRVIAYWIAGDLETLLAAHTI